YHPHRSAWVSDTVEQTVLRLDLFTAVLSIRIIRNNHVVQYDDVTVPAHHVRREADRKHRRIANQLQLTFGVVHSNSTNLPAFPLPLVRMYHLRPIPSIYRTGQNRLD